MKQKNKIIEVYGLWFVDLAVILVTFVIATYIRFGNFKDMGDQGIHFLVCICLMLFCRQSKTAPAVKTHPPISSLSSASLQQEAWWHYTGRPLYLPSRYFASKNSCSSQKRNYKPYRKASGKGRPKNAHSGALERKNYRFALSYLAVSPAEIRFQRQLSVNTGNRQKYQKKTACCCQIKDIL